ARVVRRSPVRIDSPGTAEANWVLSPWLTKALVATTTFQSASWLARSAGASPMAHAATNEANASRAQSRVDGISAKPLPHMKRSSLPCQYEHDVKAYLAAGRYAHAQGRKAKALAK